MVARTAPKNRNLIRVGGLDPSLRNLGIARAWLDVLTEELSIYEIELGSTESQAGKTVRKNSDDLRCAMEQHKKVQTLAGFTVAFAEIPSGAQSARASFTLGIAVGVVASCPCPIIQVQPSETKMATVGSKTASKREMIEWATALYPNLSWITANSKKTGTRFTDANEHMADAIAVIHAGIRTLEFQQLRAIMRAHVASAA